MFNQDEGNIECAVGNRCFWQGQGQESLDCLDFIFDVRNRVIYLSFAPLVLPNSNNDKLADNYNRLVNNNRQTNSHLKDNYNRRVNRQTNSQLTDNYNRRVIRQTNRHLTTDNYNRQANRQTSRQTERQINRQTNRQTSR